MNFERWGVSDSGHAIGYDPNCDCDHLTNLLHHLGKTPEELGLTQAQAEAFECECGLTGNLLTEEVTSYAF